ncbi:MAG: DUF2752 domain-containing protein [Verrucomicrobiota bacterium]
MQLVWRPLAEREPDHELIWLSVTLVSLGLASIWFALRLPWPVCPFLSLTGSPCATCGATRSAIALLQGQFFTAWKWNPLAFLFYCAWSIFSAYALAVLATRAPRLRIKRLTAGEKKLGRLFFVALFVLNWIYLLDHRAQF